MKSSCPSHRPLLPSKNARSTPETSIAYSRGELLCKSEDHVLITVLWHSHSRPSVPQFPLCRSDVLLVMSLAAELFGDPVINGCSTTPPSRLATADEHGASSHGPCPVVVRPAVRLPNVSLDFAMETLIAWNLSNSRLLRHSRRHRRRVIDILKKS